MTQTFLEINNGGTLLSYGPNEIAVAINPAPNVGIAGQTLTLTNYHGSSVTAPVVTIGMAFCQGDIPSGHSLTMTSSSSVNVPLQADAIATWGDGSLKYAALSFTSPDTFAGSGSNTYTLGVSSSPFNTTPAFTLAALLAAQDPKIVFTGFDCGTNTFECSLNQIVSNLASGPAYWGQYALAYNAAAAATSVTLTSGASSVSKGMTVTGPGSAANCFVTSVSGSVVSFSPGLTSGINAGCKLTFGSPLGGYETICSGPNCMEWRAWCYLYAASGPNAGAYHTQVRCTIYVRAWGSASGALEIYGQLDIPNIYGPVAGGTVGPTTNPSQRFVCNATVQNGSTVLYYFGGVNDPRSFTCPGNGFQSDGSYQFPSSPTPPNWMHLNSGSSQGVCFVPQSGGALPAGYPSNTAVWMIHTGTTNNVNVWIWRATDGGPTTYIGVWTSGKGYGSGAIVGPTNNAFYVTEYGGVSGSTQPNGAGPVSDGGVTWVRLPPFNFTATGSGNLTCCPTVSVFPMSATILATSEGLPIWSQGSSSFASRPYLMPSYNQAYLAQTKFVVPFDFSQTTYAKTSYDIISQQVVYNQYTEYSPNQTQPWNNGYYWNISQYGDNPGDERVGYLSSLNAAMLYQQTDPICDLMMRSVTLGFSDYPYTQRNELTGQYSVTNAGPAKTPQGPAYPGLGPIDLISTTTGFENDNFIATCPPSTSGNWNGTLPTYGPFIDESHIPFMFTVPYLRTGHRIYLDNAIGLACGVMLAAPNRSASVGNLVWYGPIPNDTSGQLRGQAWRLKCIAQANFMMPDNNIMKPFFKDMLDDTANYFEAYYSTNQIRGSYNQIGANSATYPQLATLGFVGNVGASVISALSAYQLYFLMIVVAMEAWRDALDGVRPQWKEWVLGYGSRFIINVMDPAQGGGFWNLNPAQYSSYYGYDPSAAFQTPAQFWAAPYNNTQAVTWPVTVAANIGETTITVYQEPYINSVAAAYMYYPNATATTAGVPITVSTPNPNTGQPGIVTLTSGTVSQALPIGTNLVFSLYPQYLYPPNTTGFQSSHYTATTTYPFDTVFYGTIWACALALMDRVGSAKARSLFTQWYTQATTGSYTGIIWSQQNSTYYDANTAQSYMPWCCAPVGMTMPS